MNNLQIKCRVCGSKSQYLFSGQILTRLTKYYQCKNCDFLETEYPVWLDQAYKQSINSSDYGIIERNLYFRKIVSLLIYVFYKPSANYLDYAGGHGIFTRIMRDWGYKFFNYDLYTKNIFSENYNEVDSNSKYELITCFECFEHVVMPLELLSALTKKTNSILISTMLVPSPIPKPGNWWYFGEDHGQHISFYSKKTLEYMASSIGMRFYTNNINIHLFTKKKIPYIFIKIIFKIANQLPSSILKRKINCVY